MVLFYGDKYFFRFKGDGEPAHELPEGGNAVTDEVLRFGTAQQDTAIRVPGIVPPVDPHPGVTWYSQ